MRISLFKQISFLVSPGRKWSAASGKGNSYKTKRRKGVIYSLNSDINFGLQPNAWWAVKSSFKPKGTRNPLRTIPGSLSYSRISSPVASSPRDDAQDSFRTVDPRTPTWPTITRPVNNAPASWPRLKTGIVNERDCRPT